MIKEINYIDLYKCKLIHPTSIIKRTKKIKMYDIILEKDKTFFFKLSNYSSTIYGHNCDGSHISSLLVNFFYKWFPNIIEEGRLKKLITPLIVCDYKGKRKYFYSIEEFNTFTNDNKNDKTYNVNYLKGLGSLSIDDWKHVMDSKKLFQIVKDKNSDRFLDIAFGDDSDKRKDWLRK